MTGKRSAYEPIFQTRGGGAHISRGPARSVVPVREFRRHWVSEATTRLPPPEGRDQEPDAIRLISAWKANKRQRTAYEKDRS